LLSLSKGIAEAVLHEIVTFAGLSICADRISWRDVRTGFGF
jgi:hypothetical protein